jgi:hypothetical protein
MSKLLELSVIFGSTDSEELEVASAAELAAGLAEASELDSGLAAVALELGCSTEELDASPAVAELDFGLSTEELDSGVLLSSAEEVLSQLAQKNPVKARAIFFQCL